MKYTTHLTLHSQAARLCGAASQHARFSKTEQSRTGLSPSMAAYSKAFRPLLVRWTHAPLCYNPENNAPRHAGFKLGLVPASLAVTRGTPFCHYTLRLISIQPEGTFGRLRYSFGGDRPSQTAHLALSSRLQTSN